MNWLKRLFKKNDGLMPCPKCGRRVSKAARQCPQCAHPIGITGRLLESKLLQITILICSAAGVNGLWFFDVFKSAEEKQRDRERKAAKTMSTTNPNKTGTVTDSKSSSDPVAAICKECKGTHVCPQCHGKPKTDCPRCKKTGKIVCENCQGVGKLECPRCQGRGTATRESKLCDKCSGKGKLDCGKCKGDGKYRCQNCGGKGATNCVKCGGSGKCTACN